MLTTHGDHHNATRALGAWGKALLDNGELKAAESKINQALTQGEPIGNQRLHARHTGQLGELAIFQGKYEDAEKQLREAMAKFASSGDRRGAAEMGLTLANVLARRGKTDDALAMIHESREAFQASGNRRGEARTWGQEGAIHGRAGELAEARRHFERAIELFREIGDRRGEATALGDLASTWSGQGRLAKAAELLSEALEMHRQMASKRGPATVMFNLGLIYFRTGRVHEARSLMEQSLAVFEQAGNEMNACFAQRKLADMQLQSGDLTLAGSTLDTVLARSREVGSRNVEAQTLATSAELAAFTGRQEDAIRMHEQSRALRKELKQDGNAAANELALARFAILESRLDDADDYLQNAADGLSRNQQGWRSILQSVKAQLEATRTNHNLAAELLNRARTGFAESNSEDIHLTLMFELEYARALSTMNRVDEATVAFDEIIQTATECGFVAIQMQARFEQIELASSNARPLSRETLVEFQDSARQSGFTDIADRVSRLLPQADR